MILLVASLVFLGVTLARTAGRLPPLRLRPGFAVGALLAICAGIVATALVWRMLLRGRRASLTASQAVRIVSLSQLGKYLPGGFWQPLGQVQLARDAGVGMGAASVTILISMVVTVAASLTVGPVLLVASGAAGGFVWLLLVVPPMLAVLHPRVIRRVLVLGARVTRRPEADTSGISVGRVALASASSCGIWLLYGTGLVFTSKALGLGGDWVLLTGAFATAWAVGFLAIPVPGGLGVREAVLLGLLSTALDTPQAVALAVASRVVFILAEAAMAGVALGIGKRGGPSRAVVVITDD